MCTGIQLTLKRKQYTRMTLIWLTRLLQKVHTRVSWKGLVCMYSKLIVNCQIVIWFVLHLQGSYNPYLQGRRLHTESLQVEIATKTGVTPLWASVIIYCLFLVKHFLQDHRYNSIDWWTHLMITKVTFIENLLPELHHRITTPAS